MKTFSRLMLALLVVFITTLSVQSQTPGIIISPAGGCCTVLDPNGDGWVSTSSSGYVSNDITESEIAYKSLPWIKSEPTSDLRRGPNCMFTDIVRQSADNTGTYIYYDGTNILIRFRIGSTMSGTKSYCLLFDTDSKFGPSGPNADPNYQAQNTGVDGNPGFEIEVDLSMNFGIRVYNVDGNENPITPVYSTSWAVQQQRSIALTTNCSDPDYFYDFYFPQSVFTSLGVTASTPLRVAGTTSMSLLPAIGGPKSDIWGMDDSGSKGTNDAWTNYINLVPPFTLTSIGSGGSGIGATCTAAPTLNFPISSGTSVNVTGTWTRYSSDWGSTATITLYKNGTSVGTTTCSTRNTWTINVASIAAGDIFYAKAQASGESQCEKSNEYQLPSCATYTSTTGLTWTCATKKGADGGRPSGASVKLYQFGTSGYTLIADDSVGVCNTPTCADVYYLSGTPLAWHYTGVTGVKPAAACSGGSGSPITGSFFVTATTPGNCESAAVMNSVSTGNCEGTPAPATTATPVITTELAQGITTIKGTSSTSAGIGLFVNGYPTATTTASSGAWTITLTDKLDAGDVLTVYATDAGSCASAAVTNAVSCYTAPPRITVSNNLDKNWVTAGSVFSGTCDVTSGTVTVYDASSNLAITNGTATVSGTGTWATTGTAVAGTSYYAIIVTSCGTSSASATVRAYTATSGRCGTITTPVSESASSVAGTLTGSVSGTVVYLYEDGTLIDSTTTANTAWSITVNTTAANKIYPGGTLTIGVRESGKMELTCGASTVVQCSTLSTPSVTPTSVMISPGGTVTYTLTSTVSGILYVLEDASSGTDYATSKFGNGGTITVTSSAFATAGTYNLQWKAVSFNGGNCVVTTAVTVLVVNQPPVSNNITAPSMSNFNGQTAIPALNAADPDGTISSYTISTIPSAAAGVLYLCNPGCAAVTAGQTVAAADIAKLKFDPAATFTGTASFTYTSTDNLSAVSNTATYFLPIVNNPPVASNILAQQIYQLAGMTSIPGFIGSDGDGTISSFTVTSIPNTSTQGTLYLCNPSCAAVTVNQVITAADADKLRFDPVSTFAGNATFNYTTTDNNSNVSSSALYTIPITNNTTNIPPVANYIEAPSMSNTNGATAIPPLYATDPDGTISSYKITSIPSAASGVLYLCNPSCSAVTVNQVLTVAQIAQLQFDPAATFTGTATFNYTATDNSSAVSNTAVYNIPVTNNPPVANPVMAPIMSNTLGQTAIPSLTGYDGDGSISSFTITSLPSAAAGVLYLCTPSCVAVTTNQVITAANAANLKFDPTAAFVGNGTFNYTTTDNNGNVSQNATYTLPVNSLSYGNGTPPVTANVNNSSIANNAASTAISSLSATDADGTVSSYTIKSIPDASQGTLYLCTPGCAAVTVGQVITSANAGSLQFDPTSGFEGNVLFDYISTDNLGNIGNMATFTIPVTSQPPTADNKVSSSISASSGATAIPSISGSDNDGSISSYRISSIPSPSQGVLYLCNPSCVAVTAGQTISTADAGNLQFDPVASATGYVATFNYVSIDNTGKISNQATFNIPISGGAPLPVEIVNFNAVMNSAGVVDLKWTTESEMNSNYFEVERSVDGNPFTTIGRLQAAGNSVQVLSYKLSDLQPQSGNNYYRLKVVDLDGSVKYFNDVVAVKVGGLGNGIKVYPIPTDNLLSVDLQMPKAEVVTVGVYSLTGQLMFSQDFEMQMGGNKIQLSLDQLPTETFELRIVGADVNEVKRIVKSN